MNRTPFALVLTVAFAAHLVPAQIMAPDFDMYVGNLTPSSMVVGFRVQGPPNSPVQMLMTLDDPFSTPPEQIIIYPIFAGQTNQNGQFVQSINVLSWQGPLPDVWFAAIIATPQGLVVPELICLTARFGCLGCLNLQIANTSVIFIYDRLAQVVHIRVSDIGPYSVWECNGPCPQVGQQWNAGNNCNFLGNTIVVDGRSTHNGPVAVPTPPAQKCIVIRSNGANGVVVGVHRL